MFRTPFPVDSPRRRWPPPSDDGEGYLIAILVLVAVLLWSLLATR